jgi:hypothetical protein
MILKSSSGVISSPCSLTLLQSSNKREIRWHVSGGGNGPAIVLKSDDLIRWTSFWTNSAPTADDFEFTVDTTGGKPAAFFRVVK